VEKGSPKILATYVIFERLPRVNNRPIGENWANLVTLIRTSIFSTLKGFQDEANGSLNYDQHIDNVGSKREAN
jgi:hypothetical protein